MEPCPACGAALGGREGCGRAFEELGLRRFSDVRYARWSRVTIDAYSLQHPDEYMRSAKSFAAHLTGAAAAIERAGDAERVNDLVVRWLSTSPALVRPVAPAPRQRGGLTIADVLGVDDPANAIPAWTRSAWQAYAPLHATARAWIALATRERVAVR